MAFLLNLTNLNASEPDEPTSWALSIFWTISFTSGLTLIVLWGILGNILVIFTSLKSSMDRNRNCTIDVYILHLSIADFLFLIFCVPFQGTVYILNNWPYGLMMCKMAYYCQYVTMYASIWILTLMSVDRYVAIALPLKSVKWRTVERATRFSVAAWTLATLFSLPWLYLYTTVDYGDATVCFDYSDSPVDYRRWLILISFLISFLLPSMVIFCMALLICASLQTSALQTFLRSSRGGSGASLIASSICATHLYTDTRRRRKVVWMVFGLSAWYLFCWLPHSVLLVWLNFDPRAWMWVEDNAWTFFILKIVGHMGTYVHSTLNPVLYSLAYEQFRRRLISILTGKPIARKESTVSAKLTCPLANRQLIRAMRESATEEGREERKKSIFV